MRVTLRRVAIALGVVTLACSSGDITGPDTTSTTTTNTPTTVVITPPTNSTLLVGQSISLVAAVKSATGQDILGLTITWSSSDNTVATVSATGILTGVKAGVATITAANSGKSASVTISVVPVPVKSVTVALAKATLLPLETTTATVTPKDSAGGTLAGRTVTFSSSNNSAATVSAAGVVTAVAAGTASIVATVDGIAGSATVTVQAAPPAPIATIAVTLANPSVVVGGTTTATALAKDAGGATLTGRTIDWSSSDVKIATVTPAGLVTAVSVGTVTITATGEGKTGTATFTVTAVPPPPVASVNISVAGLVFAGRTAQAVVELRDAGNNLLTNRTVVLASSNTTIATITQTGVITATAVGGSTITATSEGVTGSFQLTVLSPGLASIALSAANTTLQPTATSQVTAVLKDALNNIVTGVPVVWASTNNAVATVSQTGLVTAVGSGSAQITLTSSGISGSISIVVPSVTTVTVAAPQTTLQPTQTTQATLAIVGSDGQPALNRVFAWTSSNPAAVSVSNTGFITAVASGTAQVTVTSETRTGSVTIVVPSVTTINVTAPVSTLQPTQTTQAAVSLVGSDGQPAINRTFAWTSANNAVATVSATGLVTAIASGTTNITVTSEGKTGTVAITVPPVTTITITANTTTLQPGQIAQAAVALIGSDGQPALNRTFTWSSSNPAAATVSTSGVVTAVASGTTNITVTSEGVTGTLAFTVPPVATINVAANTTTLQPTQTVQAAATLLDANGNAVSNRTVVWASSNGAVATVSQTGLVTAVASGTTNITVTSEGKTGTLAITVPPVVTINVTAPSSTLQPTQTSQAVAALLDGNGVAVTNRAITWASSNPAAATVSQTGLITAVAAGTTNITLTSEGITGTLVVTVPPVATINVTAPNVTRQPTQTTTATFTLLDANGLPCTNRAFTWASSNQAVATVTQAGVVTAIASGTTNITVTSEGKTGTLVMTVPPVATVVPTAPITALIVGQTMQINVSLLDAQGQAATNRAITFTSGTPAVATVSNTGLVTPVTLGTTVITVSSEGKNGTLTFTIVPPVGNVTMTASANALFTTQTATMDTHVFDTFGAETFTVPPTYTTSDATKATVTQQGLVTAVNGGPGGNVTITATAGNKSATQVIAITGHPPETVAQLPQVFLNTAAPPAPDVGGQVFSPLTAAAFQQALNNAVLGDVIELANGVTYIGNFTLQVKGAFTGKWITIRPANMTGMPAEGQRMTPTIAANVNLPIVLSPSNAGAIITSPNSHHYRIIGIEVSQVATVASNTGLVRLGEDGTNPQTVLSTVPHDFVLDRMYIHGPTLQNTRRCVGLNSASSAVIDSWLSDCHENGADAQAINTINGPGPFKINNNYLEASGENIMFGGGDPNVPNLTPSDIEIRGNHFFKPTGWKSLPQHWLVKNLFEIKHAQRVLVENNVFENNWTDGQAGTAVAMKTVNQNGACTWCVTQDITFRNNLIRNVGGGITLSASPDNAFQDTHARRITITDNIIHSINTPFFDGIGQGVLLNGDLTDVVIAHNTIIDPTSAGLSFGGPTTEPITRLNFRDNLIGGGVSGMKGSGFSAGTASFNAFTTGGSVFLANGFSTPSAAAYPAFNTYPTTLSGFGFLNSGAFDFHLTNVSILKGKGTDNRDPGADIDAVLAAVANVIVAP